MRDDYRHWLDDIDFEVPEFEFPRFVTVAEFDSVLSRSEQHYIKTAALYAQANEHIKAEAARKAGGYGGL